jgi:DnaJ domain
MMGVERPVEAYPLTWPTGQPRTAPRRGAEFKVELRQARDELLNGLKLLGARSVVISSSLPLRRDGLPLANTSEPNDPGVAVYFDRRKGSDWAPFVIACDTYRKVRWNLRAIGVTVEALRAIQRHGASSLLEQAFTGFAALPPATVGDPPWWEVLGVSRDAGPDKIRDAFRELARIHHPDVGGDSERMAQINRAHERAREPR